MKRNLPEDILKLRNKNRTKEFDNKFAKEHIIYYKKEINILPKVYKSVFYNYRINGINDILRFNISKFLTNMDNPRKSMFVLTSNSYKEILAKRVYHLNMVIKYTLKNELVYRHFRIVLTRNRIVSIEEVKTG